MGEIDTPLTKICSTCKGEPKPTSEFYTDAQSPSGLNSRCKKCKIKSTKTSRDKRGKSKRSQYEKEYYQRTKDKHRIRQKRFLTKNPDWNKFDKIKRRYGLTKGEYIEMYESQGGKCKICNIREAKPVDHCHSTGKVRGLLCSQCNSGLGYFGDNIITMESAIQYIKSSLPKRSVTWVDPPSGWKWGFPKILPEGADYEQLLRDSGYPERDIQLALKYSRYWTETEGDTSE